MNNSELKALREFESHCKAIEQATELVANESDKDVEARIKRARKEYKFFVEYYFPHYAKSECADFQLEAADKIKADATIKAVFEWARGHAKSVHITVMIPLWLKIQQPRQLNTVILIGKSGDKANTLLGSMQAELMNNKRYINDYGVQHSFGNWQDGEFLTRDGCYFKAFGRDMSARGIRNCENRPDVIIISDIDDDEMSRNPKRVRLLCDELQEATFATMDMGRGRFLVEGNRISNNSVIAHFAKKKGVFHSKVNAIDKNGKPSWHQKYTLEEINKVREFMGMRAFEKEYMNNPIVEGTIFKQVWIKFKKMHRLRDYDMLVAYGDPSFKEHGDYKAIRLWGKKGNELHLIWCYVRQSTVNAYVRAWYDLNERIPSDAVVYHYMEANFMQDTILDEFEAEGKKRGYHFSPMPDMRKKPDKLQRIESISPLWERGLVWYNIALENDPDMQAGIEQTLAIEKGSKAPDDAPDADEGAINKLQNKTRNTSDLMSGVRLGAREESEDNW